MILDYADPTDPDLCRATVFSYLCAIVFAKCQHFTATKVLREIQDVNDNAFVYTETNVPTFMPLAVCRKSCEFFTRVCNVQKLLGFAKVVGIQYADYISCVPTEFSLAFLEDAGATERFSAVSVQVPDSSDYLVPRTYYQTSTCSKPEIEAYSFHDAVSLSAVSATRQDSCASFNENATTEAECKIAWQVLYNNNYTSDSSQLEVEYVGAAALGHLPNGCVLAIVMQTNSTMQLKQFMYYNSFLNILPLNSNASNKYDFNGTVVCKADQSVVPAILKPYVCEVPLKTDTKKISVNTTTTSTVALIPSKHFAPGTCTSRTKCHLCEGDCDTNEDCADGLWCSLRADRFEVSGCNVENEPDLSRNFCVNPNTQAAKDYSIKMFPCKPLKCPAPVLAVSPNGMFAQKSFMSFTIVLSCLLFCPLLWKLWFKKTREISADVYLFRVFPGNLSFLYIVCKFLQMIGLLLSVAGGYDGYVCPGLVPNNPSN